MMQFYRCPHCEELSVDLFNNINKKSCCGVMMEELQPNNFIDAKDEHEINIRKIGNFVTIFIGVDGHPMVDIHHISWVILETDQSIQFKALHPGNQPIADFLVAEDERVKNVYVYCTLHSLWTYSY